MKHQVYLSYRPTSALGGVRGVLAGIAALGLLTLAFIVGAFALVAFGVVALVAAVVLMIRIKWLQHKHRRSEPGIIEGEYTVVREDEPTHRQP